MDMNMNYIEEEPNFNTVFVFVYGLGLHEIEPGYIRDLQNQLYERILLTY